MEDNYNAYYRDEAGQVHREIPLGTAWEDAYARTNCRLTSLEEEEKATRRDALAAAADAGQKAARECAEAEERLGARIDGLIVSGQETEGNSELMDIRTGADGTQYATAGAAVRGQISLLREAALLTADSALSPSSPGASPDDVPAGKVVRYVSGGEILPEEEGVLMCLPVGDSGNRAQLFLGSEAGTYVRSSVQGSFSDWQKLLPEEDAEEKIRQYLAAHPSDISTGDYYGSMALFETVGVVGDSYASGTFGETDGSSLTREHMALSWPQVLARRNGISVTNYSKFGMSTRMFLTQQSVGLPALLADDPKKLYILALLRNDYKLEVNGAVGYLGSLSDITEHEPGSYPDTFYGNYATIIGEIRRHAPEAAVVMMTADYRENNVLGMAYTEAMQEIAEYFGLPCLVQMEDSFFQSDYYRTNWPSGGHPSALIYSAMACAVERLMNRCFRDHKNYFRYFR